MRYRLLFVIFALYVNAFILCAQEKSYTKHTVLKGETVSQIATKYNVTPYDIYQLNPDAQKGIQENDVILVPESSVNKGEQVTKTENLKSEKSRTHVAKAKETLYSISREYGVTVDDLKNLNASALVNGLKIGQTIKIPDSGESGNVGLKNEPAPLSNPKPTVVQPTAAAPTVSKNREQNQIVHIVQPKETKYGIAKKYGITVAELEKRNPEIVSNLPIGFNLSINGVAPKSETPKAVIEKQVAEKPVVEKPKPVTTEIVKDEIVETKTIRTLTKTGYANYEVKAGDTMYSLSQYFKISEDELIQLNPTLKDGVKTGMILKVPGKGTIKVESAVANPQRVADQKVVGNSERKQLVLLLPLNAAKIQNDSVKTIDTRLRKDAFLNMTLDFYAGALVAIDSAKTLGLNVDVKIFDSEESKMSSNVENIVSREKLSEANAVIGPFYQQYVEKTAELLSDKNVPVISPLSKEVGKRYTNLVQAMPSNDVGKQIMLDYMLSKNGNVIVVSDPKRVYNRDFITKNYPSIKFAVLLDNGALDVINLKSMLKKDMTNFVVLESERTGLILATTNLLLNELANFKIQLAIIEANETLEFEEVSLKRLMILKLLYPSMTRENSTAEAAIFQKKYKEQNKVFPSVFATRGFDLTFDTLVRITQNSSFNASAKDFTSEQVESKFAYKKNGNEGYTNQGVYIMEYQDDLTVKRVN